MNSLENATLTNSTHKAEVVPIVLEPHPNADRLSVVRVFGYTCCVETSFWQGIAKGVYIPPDSLVDTLRPEFAFLADPKKGNLVRVKAKKLRGIVSFGLLVPAPLEAEIGEDYAERLGVLHWNPPETGSVAMGGQTVSGPACPHVKYDLDAFRRYAEVFTRGEPVIVTEKIHGTSARYVYHDGEMYCGSRTEWKREFPELNYESFLARIGDPDRAQEAYERAAAKPPKQDLWWRVLRENPFIENFCRAHEGVVLYGEIYGYVQDLRYGHQKDQVSFAAFDAYENGKWWEPEGFFAQADNYNIPTVPLLNFQRTLECGCPDSIEPIPFDFDSLCELAEGASRVSGADHHAEGIVISPLRERFDERVGRVKLKLVSSTYLEKSK